MPTGFSTNSTTLADRRRQRGTGDDHLTRPDEQGIVSLVEERPHETGFVFAVQVSRDVDPSHRSSSPLSEGEIENVRQADAARTNCACSMRSISNVFMYFTPNSTQAFGIFTFFGEFATTSWVTTVRPCAWA